MSLIQIAKRALRSTAMSFTVPWLARKTVAQVRYKFLSRAIFGVTEGLEKKNVCFQNYPKVQHTGTVEGLTDASQREGKKELKVKLSFYALKNASEAKEKACIFGGKERTLLDDLFCYCWTPLSIHGSSIWKMSDTCRKYKKNAVIFIHAKLPISFLGKDISNLYNIITIIIDCHDMYAA